MAIVDTHCHASPYWYEPVETLLEQMQRSGVEKAALIQIIGWYDNAYPLECKRRFPGKFSVVAVVDTDQPDAPQTLESWTAQGVEGIRLRPDTRSPGADPLAIWRKAAELGAPVSCVGAIGQYAAPEFEALIRELPNLNIIIEHLGGVGGLFGDRDAAPPHERYRQVLALAQYPNVYMKVPGLGEISRRAMPVRAPFPFETPPSFIEMAVDAFGANRLMWGSDFPPSAAREGYANTLRLPMERLSYLSPEDRAWIFGQTAETLWRFE